jgi:hypothetical protein
MVLARARELISSSWTQDAEARNADGLEISPWSPEAVSWSLLGALVAGYEGLIWSAGERTAFEQLARACLLLADVLDSDSLAAWNDAPGRTQTDVLAALDEAQRRRRSPPRPQSLN